MANVITKRARRPKNPRDTSDMHPSVWRDYWRDPNSHIPHRDAGSRGRGVSFGSGRDSLDAVFARMKARGIVS